MRRNRLSFFLGVLFCTLFYALSPISAQTRPGAALPDDLIIHCTTSLSEADVETKFLVAYGADVIANQLTQDGRYFRVTGKDAAIRVSIVRSLICDGEFNPGEGPMGEVDGVWPNYSTDPGDDFVLYGDNEDSSVSASICDESISPTDYLPLKYCANRRSIPYVTLGEDKVSIAILDTGIDNLSFPHFFSYGGHRPTSIVKHYKRSGEMFAPSNAATQADFNGHGTAVAALAVNQFYKVGRLDLIELHNFRVLNPHGRGTVARLISALDAAILAKVDIINMSLGFVNHACDEYVHEMLEPLFIAARDRKIMIFVSAGNDGNDLLIEPQQPANSSPGFWYFYTVGASSCEDEETWDQSNRSQTIVDFLAPGDNISVPYTVCGGYVQVGGTSFATPLSCSVAAAYLTNHTKDQTACILETRLPVSYYDDGVPGADDSRLGDISFIGELPNPNGQQVSSCLEALGFRPTETTNTNNMPFPNPVSTSLNIPLPDIDQLTGAKITLSDLNGKQLFQRRTHNSQNEVSLESYPAGIYILSLDQGRGVEMIKIVKQ